MQVDPIKPTLKAPEIKLLKPECDDLRLNFAFNFNLRRCNQGLEYLTKLSGSDTLCAIKQYQPQAGACSVHLRAQPEPFLCH